MKMIIILQLKRIDLVLTTLIKNGIKNKFNFIFLGDSFTDGYCVNEKDSIPEISEVEVLMVES